MMNTSLCVTLWLEYWFSAVSVGHIDPSYLQPPWSSTFARAMLGWPEEQFQHFLWYVTASPRPHGVLEQRLGAAYSPVALLAETASSAADQAPKPTVSDGVVNACHLAPKAPPAGCSATDAVERAASTVSAPHVLSQRGGWDTLWASGVVPTPTMLDTADQWYTVSEACGLPRAPNATWKLWPQMQSKTAWKESMRRPNERLCSALSQLGISVECNICHTSLCMEEHIPGPGHFNQIWDRVAEAPIDRELYWGVWFVTSGGALRFNYIDGTIQMRRGMPQPRVVRPPSPVVQVGTPARPRPMDAPAPSVALLLAGTRDWLVPSVAVEARWFAECHAGSGTKVKVLWEGGDTFSNLDPADVRPRPLQFCSEILPSPPVVQAYALKPSTADLVAQCGGGAAPPGVMSMTLELEMVYRHAECITPSTGYLLPLRATHFPWLCHLCRKKFTCLGGASEHLASHTHLKKRQQGFTLEACVSYNIGRFMYDMDDVLYANGPPPPRNLHQAQGGQLPPPPLRPPPRVRPPPPLHTGGIGHLETLSEGSEGGDSASSADELEEVAVSNSEGLFYHASACQTGGAADSEDLARHSASRKLSADYLAPPPLKLPSLPRF